jgi:hypothetical protein
MGPGLSLREIRGWVGIYPTGFTRAVHSVRMTSATATEHDVLWDKIAFYLHHALGLFGDPTKLAQQLWLKRHEHKLFCDYIRPLEDMVRRMLFIAALDLSPMTLPPTPERKFTARRGMPANAGATFEPTQPETWQVSFQLALERRRPRRHLHIKLKQCRLGAGAPERISAAPSAQRLEALLRAYENRDKLAAALARKLARNAAKALDYVLTRPNRKRAHKPVYVTLFEFIPLAVEAHQSWLHRKLDAPLPKTDSS